MTRAALLPTLGDPYLLKVWLHLYDNIWKNDIDKLYVLIHSHVDITIGEYCKQLVEDFDGTAYFLSRPCMQHGDAINYLLDKCNEDYIVLLEDDCWIFLPDVLNQCFKKVESGQTDIVGSTRSSCSLEIMTAAAKKFNLTGNSPEHKLCLASNLWPSFLFCKKDTLLNTDRYFNASYWPKGSVIPYIDLECDKDMTGDTFVNTSLNFRSLGYRIDYIHQLHCGPIDAEHFKRQSGGLFSVKPLPWTHFGSLSSLMSGSGLFRDENFVPLGHAAINHVVKKWPQFDQNTSDEVARRVAVAKLIHEHYPISSGPTWYNILYTDAIHRCIENMNFITDSNVAKYEAVYKNLLWRMFQC